MTASRDPDRLIHEFLLEGEEQLQDQVYDAVRAEIEQKRQRAGVGLWRTPIMNKFLAIGLGAAAVVVALLVGTQLIGLPDSGTGGDGEPTASAEPTPTPSPSVAEPSTAAGGNAEGPFILWDGESAGAQSITVTIAAPGWSGDPRDGILIKNDQSAAPDGAGMIVFDGDLYVYGDPCEWASTTPETPATTVDELVAALTAQASRDASTPLDVSVDGYAGKSVTLHVPDDAVFSDCDQGFFGSWTTSRGNGTPDRYHQDPGQIDELWILDVDGVVTVFDGAYYEGTPAEDVAELRAIVESATFGE